MMCYADTPCSEFQSSSTWMRVGLTLGRTERMELSKSSAHMGLTCSYVHTHVRKHATCAAQSCSQQELT